MTGQVIVDGLLTGAMVGLGAVGLTLVYSILRFANFTHGDYVSAGAYIALIAANALSVTLTDWAGAKWAGPLGSLTFGLPLIIALVAAMALTGLLALAMDWLLFRRLRRHGSEIVMVIASFGASLALRSVIEFFFGERPFYYTREIAMGIRLPFGVRASADQLLLLATALLLMAGLHLLMTRTALGRAMRATSENPALARVSGIDVARVVRQTWVIGGALAAAAGVFLGLTVQLRPYMGFDLLLPLFAATILGGIGSVPGAMLGGLIIGLAEALAVPVIGAEYRAAVAFVILLGMLLVRPTGLFGVRGA